MQKKNKSQPHNILLVIHRMKIGNLLWVAGTAFEAIGGGVGAHTFIECCNRNQVQKPDAYNH